MLLTVSFCAITSADETPQSEKIAGKLFFVLGEVYIIKTNGKRKLAQKDVTIQEGDIILTKKNGQAQIKFIDNAYISIRPNSMLQIDAYDYSEIAEKSEIKLLKGGLRAITGKIGKNKKDNYKLKTPIATIGIRGTDYALMLCDNTCQNESQTFIGTGLYVGVIKGGVSIENEAGTVELDPNEYALVANINEIPQLLPSPPQFLMFDRTKASQAERARVTHHSSKSKDPEKNSTEKKINSLSANRQTNNAAANNGKVAALPEKNINLLDSTQVKSPLTETQQDEQTSSDDPFGLVNNEHRLLRTSSASLQETPALTPQPYEYTDNKLYGFFTPSDTPSETNTEHTLYQADEKQIINFGFDPQTGLSWGRWSAGNISNTMKTDATQLNTSTAGIEENIHWILGPKQSETIQLPTTGSQSYVLIGNTDPTDNAGNIGSIGSATLHADFDRQVIDAGIKISINHQVWSASQQNISITPSSSSFATEQLSVQVMDNNNTSIENGTGRLAGGFVGEDPSAPQGAAFSYSMTAAPNGNNTTVNGVAAFQKSP